MMKTAYVIGTCDTKVAELNYVKDLIKVANVDVKLINVGTKGGDETADISAIAIAKHHPNGEQAVFVDDRGIAVTAMAEALKIYISKQENIAGIIGLGGSGGSSIIAPALQVVPIGIPKILVSTLASGDVSAYVGASDVNMFHPVTDISGLNKISYKVLANAAHALAGMMFWEAPKNTNDRPIVALSMFGVTTPAVQAITAELDDFDCVVFHATGNGGQSMEQLILQDDISGVLDITTTEIADLIVGGVLSAGESRLDGIAKTKIPFVGSCGALDVVNFWAPDSIPQQFSGRLFYNHNAQITLMRTNAKEATRIGAWIGNKLNACEGEVRFLLPLKGISALDKVGGPFENTGANKALFEAIETTFIENNNRKLVKLDCHINDSEFALRAVELFREIIETKET